MSSGVMRPPRAVPVTWRMSMPSSRASRRAVLDHAHRLTDRDLVALLHEQLRHLAGHWGRDFDRALLRLDFEQRLPLLDGIADVDLHVEDFAPFEVLAQLRQFHFAGHADL